RVHKIIMIFVLILLFACNSKYEKFKEIKKEYYTFSEVIEKDNLVYYKDNDALFSGKIVEQDSSGRIVMELNYKNGIKHGQEIHFEYFYTDLPVVVLEGHWTNGKKSGIWKSHDGEGQMTIIRNYNDTK
ncbi:MAG: hypothetical protein KAS18_01580, partial [Calditrichia bacterium]|nr:hypothetical protein [Calditrichia bacterium]